MDNLGISDRPELTALIKESVAKFEAMPLEEQEALRRAQRESWVRGEMALGKLVDGKRHVMPDGSIRYDDYEAYCFD